ncbi:MAG: transcription termination factor NusA [Chloroflexota bacterium]
MKKDFALAFSEVLEDKQLPEEIIVDALQAAMVSAYRKTVNASAAQHVHAEFNLKTGEALIFAEKEVAEDIQDERTETTLDIARQFDAEAELGDIVIVESTPPDFGRMAAQTARQVIQQRIREAERKAQFEHFNGIAGEVVNGIIQAVNPGGITLGLERKAEGHMPRSQQIRGERFRVHDRVRALLLEVKQSPRGPQIILSRAHRNFLRRFLEDEVPEIYQGLVEIRSIAREPGYRSKVAVAALQPGVDPVGACVGLRGVRIQAIVRELNDEKIDVIEWNPDPQAFIAKALSPARVTGVFLDETRNNKTATVVVPEDQLSLAIGRDGQNARLAAKLTSWRIDIKSLPEAASDALNKLQSNPEYLKQAEEKAESIPKMEVILAKKAEGRPLNPEDYKILGSFVNEVESGAVVRRQEELEKRLAIEAEIKSQIPVTAFDLPLDELGISPRIAIEISGEGFSTIGELMFQLALDSDQILAINNVGPKTMEAINESIEAYEFPEPVVEEVIEEVVEELASEELLAEEGAEETIIDETETATETSVESEAVVESAEPEVAQPPLEEIPAPDKPEKPTKKEKGKLRFVESDEDKLAKLEDSDKTKGKKRKYRQVEYDPDLDVTIVRKRRKGDEDEWDQDL